ncbi:MAG: hypothetical protein WAU75_02555, partial [Solirubrobacteraceae bacterium]
DHEWGDDGHGAATETADPVDGIVDRYHLSPRGAARAGLGERVGHTARRVAATEAECVLQVMFEHDEAPEWETATLRGILGEHVPVVSVRLPYARRCDDALAQAAAELQEAVAR